MSRISKNICFREPQLFVPRVLKCLQGMQLSHRYLISLDGTLFLEKGAHVAGERLRDLEGQI
jgi:hypothetical protein